MYTLDTNAIIYFLAEDQRAVAVFEELFKLGSPLYASTITVVELFSHPNLDTEEKSDIERLLSSLLLIPVDSGLARAAGELRSKYRQKTPDSVIAATALHLGTTLITRNTADFRRIAELNLWEI